jgi:signal transduction histidine kinase
VVASLGTWWMVLSHESQEQSERELLGSMRHLEDTRKSLVESEKLASLGGLVAGVAHEINTPVGISVSTASFLSDRTRIAREQSQAGQFDPAAQARYLQEAEASAKLLLSNATRVAELVLNFKQLAVDRIAESRRRFDLRSQIEATIAALRPRLDDARVQVDLDPGEAITMESYPVSLAQVVTNLVVNALQHAFVPGHGGHIRIHASLRDRDEVTLELTDDGRGIDPGLHAKVFEPFFTTNRQLGGSGLGLYIVNQVVTRQLGGSITLESRPGEGSRFVLCIPRATRHAPDVVRILAEPPRRSPDAA